MLLTIVVCSQYSHDARLELPAATTAASTIASASAHLELPSPAASAASSTSAVLRYASTVRHATTAIFASTARGGQRPAGVQAVHGKGVRNQPPWHRCRLECRRRNHKRHSLRSQSQAASLSLCGNAPISTFRKDPLPPWPHPVPLERMAATPYHGTMLTNSHRDSLALGSTRSKAQARNANASDIALQYAVASFW